MDTVPESSENVPVSAVSPSVEGFPQWLFRNRTAQGMTQDELARRINSNGGTVINGSVISHWESGNRSPNAENVLALCVVFDVEIAKMMSICKVRKALKAESAEATATENSWGEEHGTPQV
jgi:transcriptional regulator with XRE-family HTH domain